MRRERLLAAVAVRPGNLTALPARQLATAPGRRLLPVGRAAAAGEGAGDYQQALAHRISVAPGPIFSEQRGFSHCLRLNYGQSWDARSEQAVATLGRLVTEAMG